MSHQLLQFHHEQIHFTKRVSREDLSTFPGNALGRSIEEGIYVEPLKGDLSYPPDPTLYINAPHTRGHLRKSISMLLEFFASFTRLDVKAIFERSKRWSVYQGIK